MRSPVRTAAIGAAAAAVLGVAAGNLLRPELAEIDSGRTLVVSEWPDAYPDRDWAAADPGPASY